MEHPLSSQDIPQVLSLLSQALSLDPAAQKQAELQLQGAENRSGFCSCLVEIIADPTNDHSARWLAATQLKNGITRNWRSRPGQGISEEEKAHLRSKISAIIPQDDNQIAVQVALMYAKIARVDYPRQWPSLFQDLLDNLQRQQQPQQQGGSISSSQALTVRRVYLVLHHIIKELSSKRLLADQKNFGQISDLLLPHIWSQWCTDADALMNCIPGAATMQHGQGQGTVLIIFERWLLLLKVLRRLVLFGQPSDSKSLQPVQAVSTCAPAMVQVLQQLLALRPAVAAAQQQPQASRPHSPYQSHLIAMMDRGVLKLVRSQLQLLELHPWSLHASGALLPLLGICCDQIMCPPVGRQPVAAYDRLLVACMMVTKGVMECPSYKGKTAGGCTADQNNEQDQPILQLANQVQTSLTSFWMPERLQGLCLSLIGHFTLTARDLEHWSSNPEEFFHASGAGTSGGSDDVGVGSLERGAAAEALFLSLLSTHQELLAPVVVSLLKDTASRCPPGAGADPQLLATLPGGNESVAGVPTLLLRKDAAFNAAAVGAYELHDYIDWSNWLRSELLPELGQSSPTCKPLRRRIARLVSQWVARVTTEERTLLYYALLQLLSEPDCCMALTAVDTLRTLIDDWNFEDSLFIEFVGPAMQGLVRVLTTCEELDSQTQTFGLINLIIERMGDHIQPFVQPILTLLPQLWADSEGSSLVRIQILLAMQRMVQVLSIHSAACYPVVLPACMAAINIHNPESLSLMEDGLSLLLVLLRNFPSNLLSTSSSLVDPSVTGAASQLLSLLPMIQAAMASSTEHIQLGISIITSMTLIGGAPFLLQYQQQLVAVFSGFMGAVNERGMMLMFPSLDAMLTVAPAAAPQLLRLVLLKLLGLVLGGGESQLTETNAMVVFARLILVSPSSFSDLLSEAAVQGLRPSKPQGQSAAAGSVDILLSALLDLWCEGFDNLSSSRSRKLCALALCRLLALPSSAVLSNLVSMLVCVTGVWSEVEGGADTGLVRSSQQYNEYSWAAGEDGVIDLTVAVNSEDAEGEANRRRALADLDIATHSLVSTALREGLQQAEVVHGKALHTCLAVLDPAIASQVQQATICKG